MYVIDQVVPLFSANAKLIFDCVACQSNGIRNEIRRQAPSMVVADFGTKLDTTSWIMFYNILVKFIIERKVNYFGAHLATRSYFESLAAERRNNG